MSTTQQPARWYMVNKDGMATLCTDKADAEKEAADAQSVWPHMGPHRAVQLVEVADVEALRTGYAAARLEIQSLRADLRPDPGAYPVPQPESEYPALPAPDGYVAMTATGSIVVPPNRFREHNAYAIYNADQMRAYADETCAMRAAQPAGAQQPVAPADMAALQALSVTNIMLDVVPGPDGMGHEVYAKSVKDVEDRLTAMGQELEEWQLGIRRHKADTSHPSTDYVALFDALSQHDDPCDDFAEAVQRVRALRAEVERLTRAESARVDALALRAAHGQAPAQAESQDFTRTHHRLMGDAMKSRLENGSHEAMMDSYAQAAPAAVAGPSDDRVRECAARLVEHADFQLGGTLSADSKARDIPSRACSQVKARHLAALRDALAAAPTTQPAPQHDGEFWPVDENASRKQLIAQIGQMNFRLTALRQENAGLIKRVAGQAEALQNYRRSHETAPQQEAQEPVWDGKLSDATRNVLNDLYLQCGHETASAVAFQVRKECDALYTSLLTAKRMYHAAQQKLEALEVAPQPSPASQGDALDAARLDWLELAGPVSICLVMDREHDGEVEVSTDDVTGYGKTVRTAIDAARAAQEGKSHG